jgi:hypothetical protein
MKKRALVRLLLRLNFNILKENYFLISASKNYRNNLVFLLYINIEKQRYKVILNDERPEEDKIDCTDWLPIESEAELKNSIKEWESIFRKFRK